MRFLSRRLWGRLAVFAVLVFNPITLIGLGVVFTGQTSIRRLGSIWVALPVASDGNGHQLFQEL